MTLQDAPAPKICAKLSDRLSRRTLTGVAAAGVGVPLLAACGGGDDTATDAGSGSSASSSAPAESGSSAAAPSESAGGEAAAGITSTSEIEVGGGAIFADEEVVITQPTEGEFKCFSAVCTHQGCLVSSIEDGEIVCECHGSHFSIEDGAPESGPASSPLEEVAITVTGDQISLA